MEPDNPAVFQTTDSSPVCRFCLDGDETHSRLIRPCNCQGTVAVVHSSCLEKWVDTSKNKVCQMCQIAYEQESVGLKKISEWTWPRPSPVFNGNEFFNYMNIWVVYMLILMIVIIIFGFAGLWKYLEMSYIILYGYTFLNGILPYCQAVIRMARKWYKDNTFYKFVDKCSYKARGKLNRIELRSCHCLFCPDGTETVARLIKPCRCLVVHDICMERAFGRCFGICFKCNMQIEQERARLRKISEWKLPRPESFSLEHLWEYCLTIFISLYLLRLLKILLINGSNELLITVVSDAFWIYWVIFPLSSIAIGFEALVVYKIWYAENTKYTFKDRVNIPKTGDEVSKKSKKKKARKARKNS